MTLSKSMAPITPTQRDEASIEIPREKDIPRKATAHQIVKLSNQIQNHGA